MPLKPLLLLALAQTWHKGYEDNLAEIKKTAYKPLILLTGAQGRTRTDTPCGGGFWVPCVYQFRHLGRRWKVAIIMYFVKVSSITLRNLQFCFTYFCIEQPKVQRQCSVCWWEIIIYLYLSKYYITLFIIGIRLMFHFIQNGYSPTLCVCHCCRQRKSRLRFPLIR